MFQNIINYMEVFTLFKQHDLRDTKHKDNIKNVKRFFIMFSISATSILALTVFSPEIQTQAKSVKKIYLTVGEKKKIKKKKKAWKIKTTGVIKLKNNKKIIAQNVGKTKLVRKTGNKKKIIKVIVENPSISKSKIFTENNDYIEIKMNNTKRNVDWSISDKSNFSIVDKTKNTLTLKPLTDSGYCEVIGKVGNKSYSCQVYSGNIIPYTFCIELGDTKNLISEDFGKSYNLKFKQENPNIISIDEHGNATAKSLGITSVCVEINGTIKNGTIIVVPKDSLLNKNIFVIKKPAYFYINSIEEAKHYLPEIVYKAFVDLNFSIEHVTDEEMEEHLGPGYAAYFSLKSRKVVTTDNQCMVLLHEFGHFFNHLKGYISNDAEFLKIFEEEKYFFNYSYPQTASNEYFAESFAYYMLAPFKFQKTHPKTFEYLDKLVDSLSYEDAHKLWLKYHIAWGE